MMGKVKRPPGSPGNTPRDRVHSGQETRRDLEEQPCMTSPSALTMV